MIDNKKRVENQEGRLIRLFLLLSLVSFFADFTYEGARSVSGPLLERLGASLIIAGTLSLGEAISYGARLASGLIAYGKPSPRIYWGLLIIGYLINLTAVPLLAIAGYWQLAFTLYILERLGKGLRVPPRDAILAELGSGLGLGRLYGIHELLDQAGAVSGALFVGLFTGGTLSETFALLAIPATIAIILLILVYLHYPSPSSAGRLEKGFYSSLKPILLPSIIIACSIAVLVHWSTAGFILSWNLSISNIALLYSLAMLTDAVFAIPLGLAYDKLGELSIVILPITSLSATLTLLAKTPLIFAVLWGLAMSGYETIAKAFIAGRTEVRGRAFAFGIAYTFIGIGWTLGNIALALILS